MVCPSGDLGLPSPNPTRFRIPWLPSRARHNNTLSTSFFLSLSLSLSLCYNYKYGYYCRYTRIQGCGRIFFFKRSCCCLYKQRILHSLDHRNRALLLSYRLVQNLKIIGSVKISMVLSGLKETRRIRIYVGTDNRTIYNQIFTRGRDKSAFL